MSKVLVVSGENLDVEELKRVLIKSGYNVFSASKSFSIDNKNFENNPIICVNKKTQDNDLNNSIDDKAHIETVFSLAKLTQSKDDDTGEHVKRVQNYCKILAEELLRCSPYSSVIDKNFIENIYNASSLYDIGKASIADSILLKNAKLTHNEFEIMKSHTIIGFNTLQDVNNKFGSGSEFIEMAKEIARSHHERWDGSGYPDGLKGDDIPLCARIVAIADVYDALCSNKVYKKAYEHKKCVDIILKGKSTQFDPYIVDAFLNVSDKFLEIRKKLK